jgi:cytochrome c peroxidase
MKSTWLPRSSGFTPFFVAVTMSPSKYLVQRPDLGDVSQGKLISLTNYFDMFNGILTPRQLEGLRLLLTPFPQQQFNATDDRKSEVASQGAACFDCHSNGHQNGTTHLAPDARPEWFRHRTGRCHCAASISNGCSGRSVP